MTVAADIALALVALLHFYFMLLEMFLWNTPYGWRLFGLSPEFAQASARLAANQGLYNGFLAAGLVLGLILGAAGFGIKVFFLSCIVIAGVFGAVTVKRSILWIQALPAAIALILLLLAHF